MYSVSESGNRSVTHRVQELHDWVYILELVGDLLPPIADHAGNAHGMHTPAVSGAVADSAQAGGQLRHECSGIQKISIMSESDGAY